MVSVCFSCPVLSQGSGFRRAPPSLRQNLGGTPRVAANIRSLKRQANGRLQLQIEGAANQVCLIEASTNLVDWQAIGTTTLSADGTFEFEDPDAANHPRRFYRLVTPQ